MKVLTVVGARPQFVKAGAISAALRRRADLEEVLVHTGQHYDEAMSASFFEELGLTPPAYDLAVGSGPHGQQTGIMLQRLEEVVTEVAPDCVVIYGDTNSTLAGALVAAKLLIPLAHVEAGLRSFDRTMPEEVNRVVADHLSNHLYCPSQVAVDNLRREGIEAGVHVVGDVMLDVLLAELDRLGDANPAADAVGCSDGDYVMTTIHRPGNTDHPERLGAILDALRDLAASGTPVIWPVHPRTRNVLPPDIDVPGLHLVDPTSYRDTLALLRGARCLVTDSGGLQKEAYWVGTPCVTVRPSTEWLETVDEGWNRLVDTDRDAIVEAVGAAAPGRPERSAYGSGDASERIVTLVAELAAG
jgi:UDP-N-acetylglucosamine 2-epimerase